MIDGNTSALNQHQREIDDDSGSELALEKARQEFSNDLFDGYFEKNYAVIDDVEERIAEEDALNILLRRLRDAHPSASAVTCAYKDFISSACDEIAARPGSLKELEAHRRDYGL